MLNNPYLLIYNTHFTPSARHLYSVIAPTDINLINFGQTLVQCLCTSNNDDCSEIARVSRDKNK